MELRQVVGPWEAERAGHRGLRRISKGEGNAGRTAAATLFMPQAAQLLNMPQATLQINNM